MATEPVTEKPKSVGEPQSAKDPDLSAFLSSEKGDDALRLFLEKMRTTVPIMAGISILDKPESADLVIINGMTEEWVRAQLLALRSDPAHFLKPTLVIAETEWPWLPEAADQVLLSPVSQTSFVERFSRLLELHELLSRLDPLPKSIGKASIAKLLLLRFLFSRDPYVLKPQRLFHAKQGYSFPLVQLLLNLRTGEEVGFLERLQETQLLTGLLIDKVNVCPFCDHTHVNFRETCPKCRSLNINDEATIHHFRCAHVGRESEYRQGMDLICPKCSNQLRHIGVDYDKPSEVMWCNDCHHNFAEPVLHCMCFVCGKTFGPHDAHLREIKEYRLSEEGFRAAEEGALPGTGLISMLKKELGFYRNEVFAEFLRVEIARCRRYKITSTLSRFNLKAADEVLEEELLKNSRKFRKDFASILNQTYRTTDIFTDLQSGDILIIFTHTDTENSKIAFKRLSERIQERFEVDLKLEYKLFDLRQVDQNLDEIWGRLQ